MSLWKFIESKLDELGHNRLWLAEQCNFTTLTVNRLMHNGQIKDGTKQKLALALKCTVGDINAAIAQQDVPEPKAHDLDLTVGEIPEQVKEVIDDYMSREPKLVPAEKIKWYPNQEPIEMPKFGPMTVAEYRDKLLGICLQQLSEAAEANVEDATVIYTAIGRVLIKELMK